MQEVMPLSSKIIKLTLVTESCLVKPDSKYNCPLAAVHGVLITMCILAAVVIL